MGLGEIVPFGHPGALCGYFMGDSCRTGVARSPINPAGPGGRPDRLCGVISTILRLCFEMTQSPTQLCHQSCHYEVPRVRPVKSMP